MRWLAGLVLAGPLAGCLAVGEAPSACRFGEPMIETRLFMGLSTPDGPISLDAFSGFVEREVATRWEEGFTILEAEGVWRSPQRGVTDHEASRVLVRLHLNQPEDAAEIEAIRQAYVDRFRQDAVMRVDSPACVAF